MAGRVNQRRVFVNEEKPQRQLSLEVTNKYYRIDIFSANIRNLSHVLQRALNNLPEWETMFTDTRYQRLISRERIALQKALSDRNLLQSTLSRSCQVVDASVNGTVHVELLERIEIDTSNIGELVDDDDDADN